MYTTWLERPKKALRVRGNLGPNNHSLLPEPVLRVPGATGTVGSTRRFEKIALRHGSLCLALVGFSHLIILCDRHCSSKRMYFCIFIVRLEIVLWLHKCIIFTEPFFLYWFRISLSHPSNTKFFYDHHTSDYGPSQHKWLCRLFFVTHLQYIKSEGLSSVLHSQTQPIRSVFLTRIHKGLTMLHKKASTL